MKKILLFNLVLFVAIGFSNKAISQSSVTVFDQILFYDGYAGLVAEGDLYESIPANVLRHSNSNYAVKLTDAQLDGLGNKITTNITLKAACDNYDRIASAFLALVPKGQTTYNSADVDRIQILRFITPFMNKNIQPMEVPYTFTTDNIAEILHDPVLRASFDIWVELDIFGVPYAAQTQVQGCQGRIDTFYGTVVFDSENDPNQTYASPNFIKPLADDEYLNNYNSTDVPGETTKLINFTLDQAVDDVTLYLITSNHGANSGGEEYNRREHFLYLDNNLVYQYKPGGKSCEPYRQFNTQGNGIYQANPQTTRRWLGFSNWCPGDVIPNREVYLGNLAAGAHTIKLDVPDAIFANGEGYIPVSMYLQNRDSYQVICKDPTAFEVTDNTETSVTLDWQENGGSANWEILYGYTTIPNLETKVPANNDGNTGATITGLNANSNYDFFVRANCGTDLNSNWVGPLTQRTVLSVVTNEFEGFKYFPNPFSNNLNIKATSIIDTVIITDVSGKIVISENINSISSEMDLSRLSTGTYFMKVISEGLINTYKLIKN